MPNRRAQLTRRLFTGALVATTLGLFAATGMLYIAQSKQRELLAVTIRTSGWVAYQAQLEYVKTIAALDVARENPSEERIEDLDLRLQLLLSRLPVLYGSEEGKLLEGIAELEPVLKRYERQIKSYLRRLEDDPPSDAEEAFPLFMNWRVELLPLGRDLQKILETSIVYNEELFRRERQLAKNPAKIPLLLMFISGAGLVALLGLHAARDRRRLNDMLALRRAQAATESSLRAVIEAMPAIIVIFDPITDRVSFVNPAASSIVDASPSHPDWQRFTRIARDAAKPEGINGNLLVSTSFARPCGDIISLRGSMCSIIWEGRRQQLLALGDITKVRDAELQVMQAAKLATLGEMATAIAHETNQPLAVIKMAVANAKRLVTNGNIGDTLLSKLDRIGDQVDRIKRITDQVRRYGRMAAVQHELFGVQEAMALAVSFVAEQYRAAGIRLELEVDLPPDLSVGGEQTMFEQVIVNILVNARDAFEGKQVDTPTVSVHCLRSVDSIFIQIDDNAGGIQPDILDRIFEPFTTTKPTGKGTGLGLSMSRHIVRDMNGDIEAVNVRSGARFTIRLPIAHQLAGVGKAA